MRKIKSKKIGTEKRRKKINKLMQHLMYLHTEVHDEKQILDTTEEIAQLEPDFPEAAEKVASIRIDLQKPDLADKAVTYLEKNFPPNAYRLFLRSRVCDLKMDYGGCIHYGEKALTYPDMPLMTRLMIYNILGHAYRYIGDGENSVKYYELSAKINTALNKEPANQAQVDQIRNEDYSNFLFSLHNINVSREKLFEEICGANKLYEHIEPFVHDRMTHPRHEKLRIGYVSPDIRRHVVAFFSYAFYKCYDKSRFEVYIYAKNKEDKVAAEFKQCVDHFRNVLFDKPHIAAQRIKDDEIDILVDLSGHTANNCMNIVAYKPAPVIISAIGWFNTTGMKAIDYFMVDKYTDPVGLNEEFFSEKMLRLQHSHFCYMWHDNPTIINPAPCTKNGYVTFVSFNTFTKVTDEALRVWAKIVNAVPNSKLFLKGKSFRDQFGTEYVLNRIEKAGLSRDRIIYEADAPQYLHKYSQTDIALDTFPYPGGGTTCDALYMGVPVITLVGDRHNARFGYSLLTNVGLGELCAFSEEEYIQKAIDLANDWDRIRDYHLTIRRKMEESPIMNDVIYMGEVEQAYEKVFDAWINGEELPEFPQDAPEISEELAEEYYNRAMGYVALESKFESNESSESVNVKRALYYFTLASQADKKHDAEIFLFISACKQQLGDFLGAYDAIVECGKRIYESDTPVEEFSDKFKMQYHERRGKLALLLAHHVEAAENYDTASRLAEDEKSKYVLYSSARLVLHFLNLPDEDIAAAHFEYRGLVENIKPFTEYHERGEKIKVGYVSPDFRRHAVFPVALGMIACHNKAKFEVTCYSLNNTVDMFTEIFKQNCEHFEDVSALSYEELANKIHDDKIDILIDLAGHSGGNALPVFAYKPAPVQLSGVGYMATTGLKTIDYFITDNIVDPPDAGHEKYFTEQLLRLPSQFCYAQRQDVPTPEYAPCTKRDYIVFGTICRYQKINDDMLNIWKEILSRVPKSILLMRAQEFGSNSLTDSAYDRMKKMGFNMDQIVFRPAVPNYMEEMRQLDMVLDAYPYVGGSTTLDALYMGVPVITLYGERRNTRFGLSILKNIGLEDLAVNSAQDYVERAVGLANDVDALNTLHKNIRTMLQKSAALHPVNYMKIMESCFEKFLEIYEQGKNNSGE